MILTLDTLAYISYVQEDDNLKLSYLAIVVAIGTLLILWTLEVTFIYMLTTKTLVIQKTVYCSLWIFTIISIFF